MMTLHQNLDTFIQTMLVRLRFPNASEFQGESALDFNFDENNMKRGIIRFANAIKESLNSPRIPLDVKATELHGEELREFLKRTIKNAKG